MPASAVNFSSNVLSPPPTFRRRDFVYKDCLSGNLCIYNKGMEVSLLKHPKKSHRKKVLLPKHSPELAEFFGIMLGDGGINNDWQATITVNALADKNYANYIVGLCVSLFGVTPAIRKRKDKQALVIALASTSVVDFLVAQGLPRGNKLAGVLQIPKWILAKSEYKRACVRGLVDTDGCLYI